MNKKDVDHKKIMKEYRFLHGYSQAEMSEILGMRQQLYSNIETGRTKLSIEFALLFKKKTGVDLIDGELLSKPNPYEQSIRKATAEPGPDMKTHESCDSLKEKIQMKDDLINSLKAQIEMLQRLVKQQ